MQIQIESYGRAREYFDNFKFLEMQNATLILDLRAQLILKNPSAQSLLDICRFAIGDCMADLHDPLQNGDCVSILPPSSGG